MSITYKVQYRPTNNGTWTQYGSSIVDPPTFQPVMDLLYEAMKADGVGKYQVDRTPGTNFMQIDLSTEVT